MPQREQLPNNSKALAVIAVGTITAETVALAADVVRVHALAVGIAAADALAIPRTGNRAELGQVATVPTTSTSTSPLILAQ